MMIQIGDIAEPIILQQLVSIKNTEARYLLMKAPVTLLGVDYLVRIMGIDSTQCAETDQFLRDMTDEYMGEKNRIAIIYDDQGCSLPV